MNLLNILFSISSLTALIIIIERLSPTTKVLLQPFNFIRLHELNQTILFLSVTVIVSFFILRLLTNNFQLLQKKGNMFLIILFIVGVYLYGAGEGWHEIASFTLNQYCNIHVVVGNLCSGLFINDFYIGNIIFFIGAVCMNISLLALSVKNPIKRFDNKNIFILLVNSIVYAFTWFAYAAFDRVLVGFFFSGLLMIISLIFFITVKNKLREYPYILYSAVAYSVATIATVLVKFH